MSLPPAESDATATAFLDEPPQPLDGFPAEEFQQRRAGLRAACPDGIIMIRGSREDEVAAPARYRQNSTFYYLTGIDTPGAYLVLLPDDVPIRSGLRDVPDGIREILFLPSRNAATETWTGAQLGPGEATERAAGIQKTSPASGVLSAITGWIRRCPTVRTPVPFGENASVTREFALMQQISAVAPAVQFRDISLDIGRLRSVKSRLEIDRITSAIEITAEGHRIARSMIAGGAGKLEYEVEAAIYEAFRSRGATLAFGTIVGGGKRGAVLHYERNNQPLQHGELVVVDIGAKDGYYCGDLTRSYPVGGQFSGRQREIYSLVLESHKRTISDYQPGVDTLKSISDRCKEFLKQSDLRGMNEKGEEKTMNTFMPHGLSHHLGLDVHDASDPELRLQPGNVITVEPGVYLPGEGIGVRIEDDYLVTETGLVRLGPDLEKEIDDLERVMRA